MAYTLRMHRSVLLSWYDHGLSTGPLEGINHKIGALQRPACGLHNFEHLTERLQSLHPEKGNWNTPLHRSTRIGIRAIPALDECGSVNNRVPIP